MSALLIPIHIYGSTHRMMEGAYRPWYSYTAAEYDKMKKYCTSMLFVFLFIFIFPVPIINRLMPSLLDYMLYQNPLFSVICLFVAHTLITQLEYWLFYTTSFYAKFVDTFDRASSWYRLTIYITDVIIIAALSINFVVNAQPFKGPI